VTTRAGSAGDELWSRGSTRGRPRTRARRTVMDMIRQIPAYLRLLFGLLTDPRVSRFDKLMVAGAIAYVVVPFDLIPDFIPFLGEVDDVYLLSLALQRLVSNAGTYVLADHWEGDLSDLQPGRLRAVMSAAAFFIPLGVRRKLRRRVFR